MATDKMIEASWIDKGWCRDKTFTSLKKAVRLLHKCTRRGLKCDLTLHGQTIGFSIERDGRWRSYYCRDPFWYYGRS